MGMSGRPPVPVSFTHLRAQKNFLHSGKGAAKMNRTARLVTVIAVAAALLSTAGCNKLKARDQLNKGVQSFRGANYEEAIEHFKNAVNLDSDLKVAKMYLATAYAQQYVPGVDTPENLRNGQLTSTSRCCPRIPRTSPASKESRFSTCSRRSSMTRASITKRPLMPIP